MNQTITRIERIEQLRQTIDEMRSEGLNNCANLLCEELAELEIQDAAEF